MHIRIALVTAVRIGDECELKLKVRPWPLSVLRQDTETQVLRKTKGEGEVVREGHVGRAIGGGGKGREKKRKEQTIVSGGVEKERGVEKATVK